MRVRMHAQGDIDTKSLFNNICLALNVIKSDSESETKPNFHRDSNLWRDFHAGHRGLVARGTLSHLLRLRMTNRGGRRGMWIGQV